MSGTSVCDNNGLRSGHVSALRICGVLETSKSHERKEGNQMLKKFFQDEQGLETVEYAVMTALIVAAMVTAIGLLAGAITGRFGEVQGVVDGIN